MKKKIFALALCLVMISGCGKKIPTLSNGEETVVNLKNGAISVDTLYSQIKSDYALKTLLNMIDKQVLEDKYSDKIEEANEYADATISQYKQYYGDNLEQAIQYYTGYSTVDAYRTSIYIGYLQDFAINDYAKDKITDKQIKDHYKNKVVEDIKVSHILIIPETTSTMTADEKKKAEDAAKKKAEEVIKKLQSAKNVQETFVELAKEYSADSSTKDNGGSLGYINKGTLGKSYQELEDAAYKLKDGQFSTKVITTELGYHVIIRLDSKKKAAMEDIKDSIIETLAEEYQTNNPECRVKALQELRKDYDLEIIDSELKEQYAKYIQNQLAQAEEQKKNQNK